MNNNLVTIVSIVTPITTFLTTLIGVWLGSFLAKRNSLSLEKLFMIKKINIEKKQELLKLLLEDFRKIALIRVNIVKYLSKEIDHKQFKNENELLQNEITNILRSINSLKVFNKNVIKDLNSFINQYLQLCDKIYEKYVDPGVKERHFTDYEIALEVIKSDFDHCLLYGSSIIDKLNEELEIELNGLR